VQSLRAACGDEGSINTPPASTESSSSKCNAAVSAASAAAAGSCSSIQQQQELLPLLSPYLWLHHLQQASSSNVSLLQQPLVCNQGMVQSTSQLQQIWLPHPQQQQQPLSRFTPKLQSLSQVPTPYQLQQARCYHPATHRARVLTVKLQQQHSWQDLQLMYDASGGGARLNAIHLATVLQQLSRLAPMPDLAPAAGRRRLKAFTAEVGVIAAVIGLVCM
jgi:hypothetical protein